MKSLDLTPKALRAYRAPIRNGTVAVYGATANGIRRRVFGLRRSSDGVIRMKVNTGEWVGPVVWLDCPELGFSSFDLDAMKGFVR